MRFTVSALWGFIVYEDYSMTALTRVPYDASSYEVGAIAHIKDHLQLAFGKAKRVTNADAITYAVLIALETIDEAPTYNDAMPYSFAAEQTRLARFLLSHPTNDEFDPDADLDEVQLDLFQKLKHKEAI